METPFPSAGAPGVHTSVSISAEKLWQRYGESINEHTLNAIFENIKNLINDATEATTVKKDAARRCLERITAIDYTFNDIASNVSTQQLLALNYRALTDDTQRIGKIGDAVTLFIEGLYEMQRGYNLSARGVDRGGEDDSICTAGTFNKLIEKLISIHPDCSINFISLEVASLKLPVIVREEARRYLKSLADPQSAEERLSFIHLMGEVNTEGTAVIWDNIKAQVDSRIREEFGSLVSSIEDGAARLAGLIDAGKHTPLNDLSDLQIQEPRAVFLSYQSAESTREQGQALTENTFTRP